jgi:hypothetical protein
MKALLGLWHGAKHVENPVLRLLAVVLAGFLIIDLFIPLKVLGIMLSGEISRREARDDPNNIDDLMAYHAHRDTWDKLDGWDLP